MNFFATVPKFCCLLILFSDQIFAEEAKVQITLEVAYAKAVEDAPMLAAAKFRVDSAKAEKSAAIGQLLPQVMLRGSWSDNKIEYDSFAADLYDDQKYQGERYGFQARQTLFNVSRVYEVERQNALLDRSKDDLDQTQLDLLIAVTEAYMNIQVADADAAQFQKEFDALVQQLEQATALYERSLISVTELLETQSRMDAVKADLIRAQGAADITRERLSQFTGDREIEPMPLRPAIQLPSTVASAQAAARLAMEVSPAVLAEEDSVSAARAAVDREKGSWWPEVDLLITQQYSDVGFDNLTSPPRTTESVSIEINYPLIQGGSGRARIRGAEAEFYAARNELETIKREIQTTARSAWLRLRAAAERLTAATQAVETSEVSVAAATESVRIGSARNTDLLLALAQETRAQRDLSHAHQLRAMAWLELELVTGSKPNAVASVLSDALVGVGVASVSGSVP
ncbi:TolC family protein [Luminiphilus sp.]|nr:TolC family protein [Luminiphilus sp.]MDA8677586.1 TolC family protein [Luminiphilus sp.]